MPRRSESGALAFRLALLGITAVAAALRIADLTHTPPGLNQDEAIGSWISWCLLKTGHDMTGQSWPIFYSHGIGDYPSTLFLYMTMPFQALGGLNVWTARLPSAVSGVLCVPLVAYVGARLSGRRVALVAATLLALNPWHLFLSRFGVGASHCSMFALLAVALLLAARLPLANEDRGAPRPAFALAAGLSAGLACYGYPPLRIYFPVLFALLALVQWRSLGSALASRAGRLALAAFTLAFAALFVPLAIVHVVDPVIAHRWEMTRLWDAGASPLQIAALVTARYLQHFSPDFLFVRGDRFVDVNPLMVGAFPWVVLPLFLAGAWVLLTRWRSSAAARTLAVLVLAYPAGDLVSRYASVHSQRSAEGVGALVLLAALGAMAIANEIEFPRGRAAARGRSAASPDRAAKPRGAAGASPERRAGGRSAPWRRGVIVLLALVALIAHVRALTRYFREFDRSAEIDHAYHVDLMQAMRWLEPRLAGYDAVFCTVAGMNEPFAITLVALHYDPHRWFAEPRETHLLGDWEVTSHYGKLWFMYDDAWRDEMNRLAAQGGHARVLFIARPDDLGLPPPLETIRRPDGTPVLLLCERVL
jgi:4-amino-4-deoxy-L-arabinose transferase-like glycosyltransferase